MQHLLKKILILLALGAIASTAMAAIVHKPIQPVYKSPYVNTYGLVIDHKQIKEDNWWLQIEGTEGTQLGPYFSWSTPLKTGIPDNTSLTDQAKAVIINRFTLHALGLTPVLIKAPTSCIRKLPVGSTLKLYGTVDLSNAKKPTAQNFRCEVENAPSA